MGRKMFWLPETSTISLRGLIQSDIINGFSTVGLCQPEEELFIEVLIIVRCTKHTHFDKANGVCFGLCKRIQRKSPYEKVRILLIWGKIKRMRDWNMRENAYFYTPTVAEERAEFFDPTKTSKAYYHTFASSIIMPSQLASQEAPKIQ